MRLQLDTYAFIWAMEDSERLSQTAKSLIQDPANVKFISFTSLWEITIKVSLGKLALQTPWNRTLQTIQRLTSDAILSMTPARLETLLGLPLHHRDPFDRLIVAQAITDNLIVVPPR